MHYLDLTLPTIEENLALDEALLLEAEAGAGSEVLRTWEWPQLAVVLGSACSIKENVDVEACKADQVPITRRASGGGTVLLGPGSLCFSLVLNYDRSPALRDINRSYALILDRIRHCISERIPRIERAGISDLVLSGRKFSGNAQQRKRRFLLHHGTLLYDFDLAAIRLYLRMPQRKPDYRGQRTHEDFLVNMRISSNELGQALREVWDANSELTPWPAPRVKALVADKYTKREWIERR